jgi:hypothetical protein
MFLFGLLLPVKGGVMDASDPVSVNDLLEVKYKLAYYHFLSPSIFIGVNN